MNDLATPATAVPAIGTPMGGGFFAGLINLNGVHAGLIVATKNGGDIETRWDRDERDVPGALSFFDGAVNTEAMAAAGIQLGTWAKGLSIGGFNDWYVPSRDELEVIYRNLKPTTDDNTCWSGCNVSAVPPTYPYSPTNPVQTSVEAFRSGGAEAFETAWYWTSTQYAGSASYAWLQSFGFGSQYGNNKDWKGRVRAVRRFLVL